MDETTTSIGKLFTPEQLAAFASQLDMLSEDQAWQIVKVVAEMMRQIEARRLGVDD